MSLFVLVKFVHVLLAIIAIGFNASYGVWTTRAAREPVAAQLAIFRGMKLLDDRFANPAYGLLLITGLTMVVLGGLTLTTLWIAAALALWFVLLIVGLGVYTPALRNQIRALEATGPESPDYVRYSARTRVVGPLLGLVVLVIVFLMVTKPTLG